MDSAGEPPLYDGRISRVAFKALIGVFFALSIVVAIIRLLLQAKIHRRLYLDDYFLIFACACLTASTVLCYRDVEVLYWGQELNLNVARLSFILAEHVEPAAGIDAYLRLDKTYHSLIWTAIFSIKFAYLVFFRRLIDRIGPLIIYWRVVTGIILISFLVCIVPVLVSCQRTGLEATICGSPQYVYRSVIVGDCAIALDIITDILLVGVPIRLLWFVKIKPRQKLIVGTFLSLNIFMVVTAAIRVSGLTSRGNIDDVWAFVWSQIEACVAISVISLTTFRSAFVDSVSSRARRERVKKPWYSGTIHAIKRNTAQQLNDEDDIQGLPKIPSATLTGMRIFIQGGRRSLTSHCPTATIEGELDKWPLHQGHYESNKTTI